MSTIAVIGGQWGDEGKGKIVDILSAQMDAVARYQGGANAGHTVKIKDRQIILHQIPTGILHPQVQCFLGNGMVIDPVLLKKEILELDNAGFSTKERIMIAHNAHVILPLHKYADLQWEMQDRKHSIGTTGKGIGPAYSAKYFRNNIRSFDILDKTNLKEKIKEIERELFRSFSQPEDYSQSMKEFYSSFIYLKPFIGDVTGEIHKIINEGKRLLLEGAQGTMLDIDHGTYPFVTSSNPTVGGIFTGLGIHYKQVNKLFGVYKSYTTRVGNGPFPTELTSDIGTTLRSTGIEYGATTGRPRRCGWFDGVLARYTNQLNGFDALIITKLDVLDNIDPILVCTEYELRGKRYKNLSEILPYIHEVKPIYTQLPGWNQDLSGVRTFSELPEQAVNYLNFLQKLIHCPVEIVSVGAERSQVIYYNRDQLFTPRTV
jgi:adenylosuccinate synthase